MRKGYYGRMKLPYCSFIQQMGRFTRTLNPANFVAVMTWPRSVYNNRFISVVGTIMEAEQLNIIANRLVDLAQRAIELRRYL